MGGSVMTAVTTAGLRPPRNGTKGRDSLMASLRSGLFGMLYVLAKQSHAPPWLATAAVVIKLLQMLLFVVYPGAAFSWSSTIAPLRAIVTLLTITGYVDFAQSAYFSFALFFISFAWVAAFTIVAIWTVQSFAASLVPSLPILHGLRFAASFSATIGFIPLLQALFSTFTCGVASSVAPDYWVASGFVCYTGVHLGLSVLAIILATVLVVLCATYALLFYDSHPLSCSLQAKRTGHVDAAIIVIKVLLVAVVEVVPSAVGPSALTAVLIASATVWLSLLVSYMPHVHHSMNQLSIGCASVYAYATLCLFICQLYPSDDAAVVLYAGALCAYASGVLLANWRRDRILACPPQLLQRSPYTVFLWAQYTMQAAVEQTLTASEDSIVSGSASAMTGGVAKDHHAALPPDFHGLDADARALALRPLLSPTTLDHVQSVLREAGRRFSSSAFMQLALGNFFAVFRGQYAAQTGHLSRAQRLGPPLDIAFLVYSASRVRDSALSDASSSDVMARVAFEKHLHVARHSTVLTAAHQAAFYAELTEEFPNITRLHAKASALATSQHAAEGAFAAIFSADPLNVLALRLHANFAIIVNNPERAAAAAAEADRIEEQAARDASTALQYRVASANGPVLWSFTPSTMPALESAAMITVGCAGRDLGVIQSVNMQACRLFGYTKVQIERRSINLLMPTAIAAVHDEWIRQYMSCGEARVLGSTIDTLAKHKDGHIFLAQMCIHEVGMDTGAPLLSAYFRPSATSVNYLLADSQFRLTEASTMSLALLGVSAAELQESGAHLDALIPSWADVLADTEAGGQGVCVTIKRIIRTKTSRTSRTQVVASSGDSAPSSLIVAHLQSANIRGTITHVLTWKYSTPSDAPLPSTPAVAAVPKTPLTASPTQSAAFKSQHRHSVSFDNFAEAEESVVRVERDAPPGRPSAAAAVTQKSTQRSTHDPTECPAFPPADDSEQELEGLLFVPSGCKSTPRSTEEDDVTTYARAPLNPKEATTARTAGAESLPGHPLPSASPSFTGLRCPFRPPGPSTPRDGDDGSDDAASDSPAADSEWSGGGTPVLTPKPVRYSSMAERGGAAASAVPELPPVEQRSAASSKRSVGARQHARLRRYVESMANRGLTQSSLVAIWRILLSVIVLNIALAVLMTTVVRTEFQTYLNMLQYAQLADVNMGNLYGITRISREINMVMNGWLPASAFEGPTAFDTLGAFSGYINSFAATHQQIFLLIQGTAMASYFTAATGLVQSFANADLVGYGTFNASYIEGLLHGNQRAPFSLGDWDNDGGHMLIGWQVPASLLDMGVQFTSNAKSLLSRISTGDDVSRSDPSSIFVMENGNTGSDLHDGIAGILPNAMNAIVAAGASTQVVTLSIYLVIVVCMVGTAVFIIAPALRGVESARDSVLSAFLMLPKPVLLRLRAHADAQVIKLRKSEESDDDESDSGSDDGGAADWSGDAKRGAVGNAQAASSSSPPGNDQDLLDDANDAEIWQHLLDNSQKQALTIKGAVSLELGTGTLAVAPATNSASTSSKRRACATPHCCGSQRSNGGDRILARRSWAYTARMLLLFCLPLIAAFVCKTTIFATAAVTLSHSTPLAAAFVSACTQRQRYLELESDMAILITTEGYWFEGLANIMGTYTALDGMQLANTVMTYGTLPPSPPLLTGQLSYLPPVAFPSQLQGSEAGGYIGVSSADAGLIRTTVLNDACPLAVRVAGPALNLTLDSCYALAGGIIGQGLYAATQTALQAGERQGQAKYNAIALAEESGTFLTPTSNNYSFVNALESADSQLVYLLTVELLPAVAGAIASIYYDSAVSTVEDFRSFLVVFPAIFLTATTVAAFLFYQPLLLRLNEDVDRKRGLLLLLPPILLLRVPHLRALIDELTQSTLPGLDGKASAGVGGGGGGRGSRSSLGAGSNIMSEGKE